MPKSKTRKGRGKGDAYAKGFSAGLKYATFTALSDVYPDGPPDREACPACAPEDGYKSADQGCSY
jgi:hypothetical protein